MRGSRGGRGSAPRGMGRRAARPVRLTRRGRLAALGFFLTVTALVSALAATATDAAEPAGERPVAVVQPGDTLWSVVDRVAPDADPIVTIEEIRRLNGLTGYTVYAGQRLTLPGN